MKTCISVKSFSTTGIRQGLMVFPFLDFSFIVSLNNTLCLYLFRSHSKSEGSSLLERFLESLTYSAKLW